MSNTEKKRQVIKVVGYIRESSQKQGMHGFRPGEQRLIISDYCRLQNFEVVENFEEWKSGGSATGRPEFMRMIEYVKRNKIRFIVVAETSRLFRNFDETREFERDLETNHGIFAIDARIDYNPREYLQSGIPDYVWEQRMQGRIAAEKYRRTLSKNVSEGYEGKRRNAGWVGPLSYGIEWCDEFKKHIRYNEDAKEIIKECYKLYLIGGKGFKALADELNNREYARPFIKKVNKQREDGTWYEEKSEATKPFTFYTVQNILSKQAYVGRQNKPPHLPLKTLDEKGNVGELEPLIDIAIFNQVQDRIKQNGVGKSSVKGMKNSRQSQTGRVYLFQGMIRHADCGMEMHGVPEKQRDGSYKRRYQCKGCKSGLCKAGVKSFRADEVESQIIELLKEMKIKDVPAIESELRSIIKITAKELIKPANTDNLTYSERQELIAINEALKQGFQWALGATKRRLELDDKARTKSKHALKYYDFQELRNILSDLAGSFGRMQDLASQKDLVQILFDEVMIGKVFPEEPDANLRYLKGVRGEVNYYEDLKKAGELKDLLRRFTPILFEEIQVSESQDNMTLKKVIFKPTGLFLLMNNGVKNPKKKAK